MLFYMMQGSSYQAEITRPKPCVPPVTMNDLPDKSNMTEGITTRSLQRHASDASISIFPLGADCMH